MDKIKIELNKRANLKVKFNKQIIEIIPYIDASNSIIINEIVTNNYFKEHKGKNQDKHLYTTMIDNSYLLAVIMQCTNVNIYKDEKQTESIDINDIMASDLPKIIESNISNFKEVLEAIKFGIAQKNIDVAFGIIADAIPDPIEQAESAERQSEAVQRLLDGGYLEDIIKVNASEMANAMGLNMDKNKSNKEEYNKDIHLVKKNEEDKELLS